MEEDECCDIGELICLMTSKRYSWSVDKCIQAFEIILKAIPESQLQLQSLINAVINELDLVEKSLPPPVPVSGDSENLSTVYDHYNPSCSPTLNADYEISIVNLETGANAHPKPCNLNSTNKQLQIYLEENLLPLVKKLGKQFTVACATIAKFLQGDVKKCLCVEGSKIPKLLNKLAEQTSLIDAKTVIREDLLPHMQNIGFIISNIVSPPTQSFGAKTKGVLNFLGKSLCFKLIDTDTLRLLIYYESFFNYILKLVSALINMDSESSNTLQTFTDLRDESVKWQESIAEARRFYESTSVKTHASLRGAVGTLLYSASIFSIIFFPGGGLIAAGLAGGATVLACGGYTACKTYNSEKTIASCKEESKKEIDELLPNIQDFKVLQPGKIDQPGRRRRVIKDLAVNNQ